MPGQIKLTANYVGSRAEKQFANQQYNYFSPDTGLRLNPNRGPIIARGNFADAEYSGIEFGVTHDFHHGLFIQGAYDYGKSLDDGSEVFTFTGTSTSYSANLAPGGRHQDWGPSAYDHRQYAAITYVWQVPNVRLLDSKGLNEALDVVARGWQFSGDSFWQTGQYCSTGAGLLRLRGQRRHGRLQPGRSEQCPLDRTLSLHSGEHDPGDRAQQFLESWLLE